jgi:two-component system NarL family response regulator
MRIMLVDDHPLFIEGLQNLLEVHGLEVIGTAGDGIQALIKARELKPDVILMDIAMPHGGGLEAITPIKAEMPKVKIVMLTSFDNDDNLFEAIKRGASGYLLKNLKAEELVSLLRDLEHGDSPLSPGLAARLLNEFARHAGGTKAETPRGAEKESDKLAPRQIEILNLVAEGKTYKEVGVAMSLTERTVKYHMGRILELLQLENKAQAIAYLAREQHKDDKQQTKNQ